MPVATSRKCSVALTVASTSSPCTAIGCGGRHGVAMFSGCSQISLATSPLERATGLSRGPASMAIRTVDSSIETSRPRR